MNDNIPFRRDNGEIIEVDFETAHTADVGFLTLPDGEIVRRVYHFTPPADKPERPERAIEAPMVAYDLGCTYRQVDEMRAAARAYAVNVEYVEDPEVKGFYNCVTKNQRDHDKWGKICGFEQKGQGSVHPLSALELEQAERLVKRQFAKEAS